jgi:glycosyltransferase involved in cell wall biosynthesis
VKKVLFVSYFWPPSGKATVHWPLGIIKHLPGFGWQPSVLTTANDSFSEKDDSLLHEVSPDLKVYKVQAFEPFNLYRTFVGKKKHEPLVASETISKSNRGFRHRLAVWVRMNLLIPDARIGWYWNAVGQGKKLVQTEGVSAIVSIGPPHTTVLVGSALSKMTGVPHVPVFIDPWVDIAYYRGFKRSRFTGYLDRRLERGVLEHASQVVFVTQSMKEDFEKRFPSLVGKSHVLYWGYDEEAFRSYAPPKAKATKVLLHAGNIFDFQNPTALWNNIRNEVDRGNEFKIVFVGTVSPEVRASIEKAGLHDRTVYKGFLPYDSMIRELGEATYLLVCATEQRHVPGKLFEYLRAGKPIVAFGDNNVEVEAILHRTGAGIVFPYRYSGSDIFRQIDALAPEPEAAKQYDRKLIAGELAKILSNLP